MSNADEMEKKFEDRMAKLEVMIAALVSTKVEPALDNVPERQEVSGGLPASSRETRLESKGDTASDSQLLSSATVGGTTGLVGSGGPRLWTASEPLRGDGRNYLSWRAGLDDFLLVVGASVESKEARTLAFLRLCIVGNVEKELRPVGI